MTVRERPTLRLLRAALLALALSSPACSGGTAPSEEQLTESRRRWIEANITSYSIVITRSINASSFPVRVTVAQGVVTSRVFVDQGTAVPANEEALYPDVDGLFDLVVDAFRNALASRVSFDDTYGFPIQLQADYIAGRTDDDVFLSATNFVPAGGAGAPIR